MSCSTYVHCILFAIAYLYWIIIKQLFKPLGIRKIFRGYFFDIWFMKLLLIYINFDSLSCPFRLANFNLFFFYRYIMFLWDWFTGVLGYLGKLLFTFELYYLHVISLSFIWYNLHCLYYHWLLDTEVYIPSVSTSSKIEVLERDFFFERLLDSLLLLWMKKTWQKIKLKFIGL